MIQFWLRLFVDKFRGIDWQEFDLLFFIAKYKTIIQTMVNLNKTIFNGRNISLQFEEQKWKSERVSEVVVRGTVLYNVERDTPADL